MKQSDSNKAARPSSPIADVLEELAALGREWLEANAAAWQAAMFPNQTGGEPPVTPDNPSPRVKGTESL